MTETLQDKYTAMIHAEGTEDLDRSLSEIGIGHAEFREVVRMIAQTNFAVLHATGVKDPRMMVELTASSALADGLLLGKRYLQR